MDDGVTVVGTGLVGARPDVVVLALGVVSDGPDVSAALATAAERTSAVAAAARAGGVADRDIRSTGAQVHPMYNESGTAVRAYRASHQARIVVRKSASVGALVAAFVEAAGDALSIDQISLEIDDDSTQREQARNAAYADALAKATQFARLAGSRLGPVLSLVEGSAGGGIGRQESMGVRAMASALPVEVGESIVRADVTVRWALG